MSTVDLADKFIHVSSQLLIFFNVGPGWHGDLYECGGVSPFRMVVQELVKRMQLQSNSFDVVQPVDTNDDALAFKLLLETRDELLRFF